MSTFVVALFTAEPESTKLSTDRWMNSENVAHTFSPGSWELQTDIHRQTCPPSPVLLGPQQACPLLNSRYSLSQEALLHGEVLSVISITDLDHTALALFTRASAATSVAIGFSQRAQHLASITHFSELHLDTVNHLGGATKKSTNVFFPGMALNQ